MYLAVQLSGKVVQASDEKRESPMLLIGKLLVMEQQQQQWRLMYKIGIHTRGRQLAIAC